MLADLFAYETLPTRLGDMRWPGCAEEVGVTPGVRDSGEYRSDENALLESWFRESQGGVFVDVGAHVGWFSLLAAMHGMRVVALEPSPTNFSMHAVREGIPFTEKDARQLAAAINEFPQTDGFAHALPLQQINRAEARCPSPG